MSNLENLMSACMRVTDPAMNAFLMQLLREKMAKEGCSMVIDPELIKQRIAELKETK